MTSWAAERDSYEKVCAQLESLRRELPNTSDGRRLVCKWIDEIRPLHRNAFAAKPLNHGTTNESRRAVIALAKPAGWQYAHVAAVLVLTGAEKMDDNGRDFKAVKDEIRKAFHRALKSAE